MRRHVDWDVHEHVAWSLNYRWETRYKYVCGRAATRYSGLRNARAGACTGVRVRPMRYPRDSLCPLFGGSSCPKWSSPSSSGPVNCPCAHACLRLVSHFCRFSYFLTFKRKLESPWRRERGDFVFRKPRSIALNYAPSFFHHFSLSLFFFALLLISFLILIPFLPLHTTYAASSD